MSAEEDGRSDDNRERRGDNRGRRGDDRRRNTPPRRGGGARGGPGGSGTRGGRPQGGRGGAAQGGRGGGPQGGRGGAAQGGRGGGPQGGRGGGPQGGRGGGPQGGRGGAAQGGRGRPGGGGWKNREQRGKRDDQKPGRPFKRSDRDKPSFKDKPFKARGGARRPQEERERPAPKHDDPLLPDEVTGEELDADARDGLRSLPKDLAAKVARHLVMAGRLSDEEPELAYKHARAARRLASRVGIVREAAGIAAYHAGEWAEALAELRAARRLGAGDDSYLPVMADCERGLGRPERALDLVKSPEAEKLDPMGRVELRIVESGVRRDLKQHDAAVVTLQIPELRDRRLRPWSVRLFYAYADALVDAGREDEAPDWFARAAAADRDGETDAAERYAELEGLHIVDTEDDTDHHETDPTEDDTEVAPEAAAVFLEPKPVGEEQPPRTS